MILETLDLKLYKNAIFPKSFSYKFWQFFRTIVFTLKTLWDYLWMESIFFVKKHLQNTSKTLLKISDLWSLYAE